ncbi:MAG: hypothetical protein IIY77_00550 [Lachnospiraceae bacterium]|nr:hypothetical protein [Lachnospiraceae bacterium]
MGIYTLTFYSENLKSRVSVNVTVPKLVNTDDASRTFPVLYLTHGNTDDRSAWLRNSSAERYADEYGLITVMTSTWSSFGMDMYYGKKYFSYLSQELVPLIDHVFPIAPGRENHFVAGLSLGGYMGFKLGLVLNDYFGAIGSFSSPVDMVDTIKQFYNGDPSTDKDFYECFGSLEYMSKWPNDSLAIARDIAENKKPMPRFYQECGTEDFTFPLNEACYKNLTDIGYDITYVKRPGTHNWEFWDAALQHFLEWTGLKKLQFREAPGLELPASCGLSAVPGLDIRADLESMAAHGSLDCEFIFPKETADDPWKKVKILIHPADDDFTYWQRKKDLEEIAEQEHIAIVCPQLYDSLGEDQVHGRPFGVFVRKELPHYVRYLFGQNREIEVEVTDTL